MCKVNLTVSAHLMGSSTAINIAPTWVQHELNCFSCVQLFATLWIAAHKFLCAWDSPGKNTEVGCHSLLQRIFPTQGSKLNILCLLHWQVGSLLLAWETQHYNSTLYTLQHMNLNVHHYTADPFYSCCPLPILLPLW